MRVTRTEPPNRFMSSTPWQITNCNHPEENSEREEKKKRNSITEFVIELDFNGKAATCQIPAKNLSMDHHHDYSQSSSHHHHHSQSSSHHHHHHRHKSHSDGNLFSLCPFWQSGSQTSSSSSSTQILQSGVDGSKSKPKTVSSVARSLLPPRRRLRLDPASKLYFPYEPGKQVKSAIRLQNSSKSHVAFKFQTTAPKSCYMRPPGGILAPGESIIATVFRFVEQPDSNEKNVDQKAKVKFKIMSLKVKAETDYAPELFDEQKDQVAVERILRVVFLDAEHPTPALEKLKRQLAEAEAALEVRKKPPADSGPRDVGEGLVIDEWKERREKYLARQQVEAVG